MRFSDFIMRFERRIMDASAAANRLHYGAWRAALNDIAGVSVRYSTIHWLAHNWHKLTDEQRKRLFATAALIFDTH